MAGRRPPRLRAVAALVTATGVMAMAVAGCGSSPASGHPRTGASGQAANSAEAGPATAHGTRAGSSPSPGRPAAPGASSPAGVSPRPSPTVTEQASPAMAPGSATPQDAVDGYLRAIREGSRRRVCLFIDPGFKAACQREPATFPRVRGRDTIHSAIVMGVLALVEVTGHICTSVTCITNTHWSTGMPASPASFAAAFDAAGAALAAGRDLSPVPCVKSSSGWSVWARD